MGTMHWTMGDEGRCGALRELLAGWDKAQNEGPFLHLMDGESPEPLVSLRLDRVAGYAMTSDFLSHTTQMRAAWYCLDAGFQGRPHPDELDAAATLITQLAYRIGGHPMTGYPAVTGLPFDVEVVR